jgi:hypothetical protein
MEGLLSFQKQDFLSCIVYKYVYHGRKSPKLLYNHQVCTVKNNS